MAVKLSVFLPNIIVEWMSLQIRIQDVPTHRSLGWLTIFVNCLDASGKLLSYRILWPATESPATGHLDTGFSWFPCVYKQMLRWLPTFQVATTCFSCSPPDVNLLVTNFIFCIHVKYPLPPGDKPIVGYYYYYYYHHHHHHHQITQQTLLSASIPIPSCLYMLLM